MSSTTFRASSDSLLTRFCKRACQDYTMITCPKHARQGSHIANYKVIEHLLCCCEKKGLECLSAIGLKVIFTEKVYIRGCVISNVQVSFVGVEPSLIQSLVCIITALIK